MEDLDGSRDAVDDTSAVVFGLNIHPKLCQAGRANLLPFLVWLSVRPQRSAVIFLVSKTLTHHERSFCSPDFPDKIF